MRPTPDSTVTSTIVHHAPHTMCSSSTCLQFVPIIFILGSSISNSRFCYKQSVPISSWVSGKGTLDIAMLHLCPFVLCVNKVIQARDGVPISGDMPFLAFVCGKTATWCDSDHLCADFSPWPRCRRTYSMETLLLELAWAHFVMHMETHIEGDTTLQEVGCFYRWNDKRVTSPHNPAWN